MDERCNIIAHLDNTRSSWNNDMTTIQYLFPFIKIETYGCGNEDPAVSPDGHVVLVDNAS